MKNYNNKIGSYLAKERKSKRITQQAIADKLGVTRTAVHYWETGKRVIYADQMLNYCNELGVDPSDLVKEVTKEDL